MSEYQNLMPPQHIQAEASILSRVFHRPEDIHLVAERMEPEDCYVEAHKSILESMLALSAKGKPADMVSVGNHLQERGLLESVGGATALAEIVDNAPLAVNLEAYTDIIREKASLRRLAGACLGGYDAVMSANGDAETVIADTLQAVSNAVEAAESRNRASANVGDLAYERLKVYESRMANPKKITGATSGLPTLDACTRGWQDSDLIVVAGRPGMGKTALACNLIRAACLKGIPTVFYSLEMSAGQIMDRLLACENRQNSRHFISGQIPDIRVVENGLDTLSEWPLWIEDRKGMTAQRIRASATGYAKKQGARLVIVDYLQKIKLPGKQKRFIEIGEAASTLKDLAGELGLPFVALAQLNREIEKRTGEDGKVPKLSDLRDSGEIEQEADIVIFIYPENDVDTEPKPLVARVAKHRNGPLARVGLHFWKEQQRFGERTTGDYGDQYGRT